MNEVLKKVQVLYRSNLQSNVLKLSIFDENWSFYKSIPTERDLNFFPNFATSKKVSKSLK